jgi:hypothetical protein
VNRPGFDAAVATGDVPDTATDEVATASRSFKGALGVCGTIAQPVVAGVSTYTLTFTNITSGPPHKVVASGSLPCGVTLQRIGRLRGTAANQSQSFRCSLPTSRLARRTPRAAGRSAGTVSELLREASDTGRVP